MALRVVVTGGSAGIGRSIVESFARNGHSVLFTYLSSVEAAQEIEQQWPHVAKTQLDQGCVQSVAAFARTVERWAGDDGVDVLVNNAALGSATVRGYVEGTKAGGADDAGGESHRQGNGVAHTGNGADTAAANGSNAANCNGAEAKHEGSASRAMERQATEDMALMRVNALGPLWVTEAALGALRVAATRAGGRRRAAAIFIGSVGGSSAAAFPEYRASDLMSKAAMTYLVRHLAARYVRDALDVMCVAPGATETAMFRESTLSKVADVDAFVRSMPKQTLIQPAHVADAVYWLATDPSARIFHGAVLDASLGLGVRPGLQTESVGAR